MVMANSERTSETSLLILPILTIRGNATYGCGQRWLLGWNARPISTSQRCLEGPELSDRV